MVLHEEQLRSLEWMMQRERSLQTTEFVGTEVRGGILADSIGFGKTVVALGLVASCQAPSEPLGPPDLCDFFLPSRATVVFVPPNLWQQWSKEVEKFFLPRAFRVLAAADVSAFRQWSVEDVAQADLIIVSYRIFEHRQYKERQVQLAGSPSSQALRQLVWGLKHAVDPAKLQTLKFPVLELFYFHRIVADEFHELVCAVGQDEHPFFGAMVALCRAQGRARWGLTSTPPFRDGFEVAVTASFFGADLRGHSELCEAFVREMARASSTPASALPRLLQHRVRVVLTRHEMALYLRELRESGGTAECLLRSSLFRDSAPSEQDMRSAIDLCKEELEKLQRPVSAARQELAQVVVLLEQVLLTLPAQTLQTVEACSMRLEDLLSRGRSCDGLQEQLCEASQALASAAERQRSLVDQLEAVCAQRISAEPPPGCLDGMAAAVQDYRAAKALAEMKARESMPSVVANLQQLSRCFVQEREFLQRLASLYPPLLLFRKSLESVGDSFECGICLTITSRKDCSIAPCSHLACSSCWHRALMQDYRCPFCRRVTMISDIWPLTVGDAATAAAGAAAGGSAPTAPNPPVAALPSLMRRLDSPWQARLAVADNELGEFVAYGSKIRSVVLLLRELRASDPACKALVFAQSEQLRRTLQLALDEFHIGHCALQGSAQERAAQLRRFEAPDGPQALLVSLQVSPSGLNALAANHVVLVQPTWHEGSHEKSVDFEEQAIGRCWRQGQTKEVHVWRLCAEDTVEEHFVENHMSLWQQRLRARGAHM